MCVVEFDVFKYVKQKFLAAIALIGFPLNNYSSSSRCEDCACSVNAWLNTSKLSKQTKETVIKNKVTLVDVGL